MTGGDTDGMATRTGTPDTYGAAEAGRVLRLSEKRVRQLADAGRLEVVGRAPLRVAQASVHQLLKDKRQTPAASSTSTSTRRPAVFDVEAVVTRTVEALVPRMLETASAAALRTEEALREQLHAERARAEAAEAELRALRATLAARRGWLRRSGPELAEGPAAAR